tara:strand:- start:2 stop:130 length:129 start_codon:yes stop_codon:yes gene_type:complete
LLTFLEKFAVGLLYLLNLSMFGVDLSPYDLRLAFLTGLVMLA